MLLEDTQQPLPIDDPDAPPPDMATVAHIFGHGWAMGVAATLSALAEILAECVQ